MVIDHTLNFVFANSATEAFEMNQKFFKDSIKFTIGDHQSDRRYTSVNNQETDKFRELVIDDHHLTIKDTSIEQVFILFGSCQF